MPKLNKLILDNCAAETKTKMSRIFSSNLKLSLTGIHFEF
jgi:hypothetical protein